MYMLYLKINIFFPRLYKILKKNNPRSCLEFLCNSVLWKYHLEIAVRRCWRRKETWDSIVGVKKISFREWNGGYAQIACWISLAFYGARNAIKERRRNDRRKLSLRKSSIELYERISPHEARRIVVPAFVNTSPLRCAGNNKKNVTFMGQVTFYISIFLSPGNNVVRNFPRVCDKYPLKWRGNASL